MTINVGDFVELRGTIFKFRGLVLRYIDQGKVELQYYTKIHRDTGVVEPHVSKVQLSYKALHKIDTSPSKEDLKLMNYIYMDLALLTNDQQWINECWNELYGEVVS